jgi:hypothetical protein
VQEALVAHRFLLLILVVMLELLVELHLLAVLCKHLEGVEEALVMLVSDPLAEVVAVLVVLALALQQELLH